MSIGANGTTEKREVDHTNWLTIRLLKRTTGNYGGDPTVDLRLLEREMAEIVTLDNVCASIHFCLRIEQSGCDDE